MSRIPRLRLRCPSCGGGPRLPRDLRKEIRCACGAALRVALVRVRPPLPRPGSQPATDDRHRPPRGAPLHVVADALAAGLPFAHPYPVYRGHGAARERAWGAIVDTPVEPGDTVQIVAKSGKTWQALVAAPQGSARDGGHLVTLRGERWKPDPMPEGATSSDYWS